MDENQQLVLSLSATDPNDDGLTMTASNMPTGATFVDHGDGTATFTWTPTFAQSGNYKVTFTTIDDGIPVASDTEEITITVGDVNRPPDLAPVGNRQVDEGQELTILLSASDPEDDTLAMTVAGLPAGASFQDNGGGAAEFRWTPGFDQAGNHQVTFFATDDGSPNLSDSEEITITVGEVNRPPVLSPVGNRNATVGEELVIALSAADPDGDSLAFSVVNAPAGGDLFDNGDGTAEFRWTPANGQGGNHQATFAVTDNGQPQLDDTEEITITVGEVNRPPRLDKIRYRSVKLGEQFSFPLQASDPDGDGLAFSAIGAPAGASLIDNGDGMAVFTWQPGDGQTGKHKVTFVVTDDGTPPASDSEQITINVVQDKKGRRKRGAARLGN